MTARVLVIDDDPSMAEMLDAYLRSRGFSCTWRTSADEAFELMASDDFHVVITDLNLRGTSGLSLCTRVVENRPDIPVIVITAFGSLDTAIQLVRAGAFDILTKPFELEEILLSVERALHQRALRAEVKRLTQLVGESQRVGEMLGASAPMRRIYDMIARVADSDTSVLVCGESGTGKELAARALHARGRRAAGPFVAINCAAMPEPLLESELFGHVKGAFTDAKKASPGLLVEASGGTLFLDEIGELPLTMQPKLLRALESRTVRPVGGTTEVPFDVRLVAATNRDLETMVEERRFRDDLFYRINVVRLEMPPLRTRGDDILLLAQSFLERFARRSAKKIDGLSSTVAQRLVAYVWPGNVRELQNCIERAVALARYEELTADDLPDRIRDYKASHVLVMADDPSELVPMEEVERRYVLRVLAAVGNNKTLAARVLGYDRKTLYRRLERYGVAGGEEEK